MNRIYQGRVSKVEIPNPDKNASEQQKWLPLENWQDALWQHHKTFQDGLNFYFAVFAAMVCPQDDSPLGKYRCVIEADLWVRYDGRKGQWDNPFAKACTALQLAETASFNDFSTALFRCAATIGHDPRNRHLAIAELFAPALQQSEILSEEFPPTAQDGKLVADDDAIGQKLAGKGRDCFPKLKQLCAPHRMSGTTPANEVAVQQQAAKAVVMRVVEEPQATLSIDEAYLFKTSAERGKTIVGELAKRELRKRCEAARSGSDQADLAKVDFDAWLNGLSDDFPLSLPGAGRTPADFNAALLFAHLPNSEAWRKIFLRATQGRARRDVASTTTDNCQMLRGNEDMPLFPFFTNLIASSEGNLAAWPDFEKQAFIEAFSKIGRFLIEQRRRDADIPKLQRNIHEFKARLDNDARLQQLARLLETLGGDRVDDDGCPLPYGIRARSLKCWNELRQEWRSLTAKIPAPTTEDYFEAKKRLQKKRRTKFGNATLFHALAEPANHCLWNHDEADVLIAWAKYTEDADELEHLESAPSFTPAHAENSPRYFRWSETGNKTHLSWLGEGPFAVAVDAFDFSQSPPRLSQWLLHYRAPRLLRDGLRRKDDVRIEEIIEKGKKRKRPVPLCDWLPPVLRARPDLYAGAKQTIAGTSVRLMPASQENFQLVLEAELDNSTWTKSRGRPSELFFKREEEYNQLKWWSVASERPPAWFVSGRTTCLSVDLGLRAPASFAIFETCDMARHGTPHRFHRRIGGPNFQNWVATVIGKGVIHLPGENRYIYRHPTRAEVARDASFDPKKLYLLEELSGARGRKPSPVETNQAATLFAQLDFLFEMGDKLTRIGSELPAWRHKISFPEQNDLLLRAFARARKRLFLLNRWDWQLSSEKSDQQAREELVQRHEDDPLRMLLPDSTASKLLAAVQEQSRSHLAILLATLPILADRILPHRGKSWRWLKGDSGFSRMTLVEDANRKRIPGAGQRGISIARIRQIQELRRAAQSLNHLCRHTPGKRYRTPKRGILPDPFVEAGREIERLKTQRAKQLAHEIFAQAIGVKLVAPPFDKKVRRETEALHGVYRPIANRQPVDFVVLERLAAYRTSEQRSRRENRQLADWGHREVVKVLEELCELVGLPILYVDPAFSSRFAAFDGCPGFRANEETSDSTDMAWLKQQAAEDDDYAKLVAWLGLAPAGSRLLRPRTGGPLFVPLAGEPPKIAHADINAAVNIGFRAVAHRDDIEHWPRVWVKRAKKQKGAQSEETKAAYILDPFSVLGGVEVSDLPFKAVEVTGRKEEALWDRINGDLAWARCHQINAERLRKSGIIVQQSPTPTDTNSPAAGTSKL